VQEQPGARRIHHEALLDHLPAFLHELGHRLSNAGDPETCPHCRPARQHGAQRWEEGWSPAEVVRDFRILRLVTLEHLEAALGRPLGLRESQAVALAFDEAIEASVARYAAGRDAQLLRWQAVFENARWGMALARPADGVLLVVNPALAAMHGCTAEALAGRPLPELLG